MRSEPVELSSRTSDDAAQSWIWMLQASMASVMDAHSTDKMQIAYCSVLDRGFVIISSNMKADQNSISSTSIPHSIQVLTVIPSSFSIVLPHS